MPDGAVQPAQPNAAGSVPDDDAALFRRVWKVVDEVQWAYFQDAAANGAFGSLAAEILALASGAASLAAGTPRLMFWSGHDTGPMLPLW
eukprot:CAMPEP_0198511564 /NCGR_PEP_ID=MMETSP1462-20131121/14890_1 /TAXON_ID=1333877 /ORGANISM="Brandtodinium nutriculum, Strain RCC3387" /LENGTH=88 /DNA_ID=CAMNT_0044240935 /DNA_START=1 /DNA_END=265 /DNA_ORIENTATION=-